MEKGMVKINREDLAEIRNDLLKIVYDTFTAKDPNRKRIKKKGELKRLLRNGSYDRIAIWADGRWEDVGTGYAAGEISGENPNIYIVRSLLNDLTWREIDELVREKERELNR